MDGVCAGIVTYNPNVDRLTENIYSIINQIEYLLIYDNGSDNADLISKIVLHEEKIYLFKSKKNYGIAYALNRIFEMASAKGYKWILSLDQDSICPNDMIRKMSKLISNNIGIICPLFADPNIEYGFGNCDNKKEYEIQQCITSGSLTNVDAWKVVNGYDEIMFIDFVDYDFCFRIRQAGFVILQDTEVVLNHTIGMAEEKNVFGKKVILTNHSNMRKYFIVRNYIYYRKKNGITDKVQRRAMLKKIIKTILFEKDKIGSGIAFFRGWMDGNRIIKGKEPYGWKTKKWNS